MAASQRSFRRAIIAAVVCALASVACLYATTATSYLRMGECTSFSFHAANPRCRAAMYWDVAWIVCGVAALALIVIALLRRPARMRG